MNYNRLLQLLILLIAFLFQGLYGEDTAASKPHRPVVYMLGDSTMADKNDPDVNPMFGWGQVLSGFMQAGVDIQNHASDGRSTRSFVAEGRWQRVREALKPGDWVVIQFGHNDQKEEQSKLYTDPDTDYREFLEKFIDEAREKGARPILATSIYRRYFKFGKVYNSLGDYPQATREVAEALDVPIVDLNEMTGELLNKYGEVDSSALFVHLEPGQNAYYPAGRHDNSHLSKLGANEVAALFAAGALSLDIGFPVKESTVSQAHERGSVELSEVPRNLVVNGEFDTWQNGQPRAWLMRSAQAYAPLEDAKGVVGSFAVGVKVIKEHTGSGEVFQQIPVEPNVRYRFSGSLRADLPNSAFYQIKLFKNGRELSRISTASNRTSEWSTVTKVFESGDADSVGILMRWQQQDEFINNQIGFDGVQLGVEGPLVYSGVEVAPKGVATFNSIGLYWKPSGGKATREVTTAYRKLGSTEWNEALPLWFDPNEHPDSFEKHTAEYRGSIVGLEAGTTYEVELTLEGGPVRVINVDTWSEDFKIARIVVLTSAPGEMHTITEGGSEEEGYVLYVPADGENSVLDANDEAECNIRIDASWVIVRGFTLKGASRHGIVLGDVNHIVIEDCDISGWGATGEDGQAHDLNSGIFSSSNQLERIVIQNCEIHHPRSDSNSWSEKRPGTNSYHPAGPQGVSLKGGKGQYVIRGNRIYSDIDHMFNDAMGETGNFGYGGFPNRDSDIYDNFVSHCWDDGLEIEGADMNVRVFNNYIDFTYGAIGAAAPCLGPVYFYRNVYGVSRKNSDTDDNGYRGHFLFKLGNEDPKYTRGRMFIFHNTALQPPAFELNNGPKSSGAQSGIVFTSDKKTQSNITTRNNVIQTRSDRNWAILDYPRTPSNDFDYDFYNGVVRAKKGSQSNAILGTPVYERAPDGRLWLAPGSLGHDAAVRIPNFNDDFVGAAPDMGAVETNSRLSKPSTWPTFPVNYDPETEQSSFQ